MYNKIKNLFKKSNSIKRDSSNEDSDLIKKNQSIKDSKSFVKITHISVTGSKIYYEFETSEDLDVYFIKKDMYVEYMNLEDCNLESVNKSILVIPLFNNLLPMSWLCDFTLIVDELDKTLYESIDNIKDGYGRMYPDLSFKGKLEVKKLVENNYDYENESISLFTYGVDSLTTVLRHIDEKPILSTIWGADISLRSIKGWETASKSIEEFSKESGLENLFIKSDFRRFMNTDLLFDEFLEKLDKTGNWWYAIQHGLALMGLSSVLAYVRKVKHIYIASSHSYAENELLKKDIIPCGSSPTLDNEYKFSSCTAVHDAYELRRADKIDLIMDYAKKNNMKFNLRVCWHSAEGVNCSVCEKCARTLMYIMACKENPEEFGFVVNDENLKKIEVNFKRHVFKGEKIGGWSLHPVTLSYWKYNQEIFLKDYDYWKDTPISWIFDIDFDKAMKKLKH